MDSHLLVRRLLYPPLPLFRCVMIHLFCLGDITKHPEGTFLLSLSHASSTRGFGRERRGTITLSAAALGPRRLSWSFQASPLPADGTLHFISPCFLPLHFLPQTLFLFPPLHTESYFHSFPHTHTLFLSTPLMHFSSPASFVPTLFPSIILQVPNCG